MNAPFAAKDIQTDQELGARPAQYASLFFVAAVATVLAGAADAAETCLSTFAARDTEVFIYSGDRNEARLFDVDRPAGSTAVSYFLTGDPNLLVEYMTADFSDWRTPSAGWSSDAITFEFGPNGRDCIAVLDGRELFARRPSSNGYIVRLLQAFERERILERLIEERTVY